MRFLKTPTHFLTTTLYSMIPGGTALRSGRKKIGVSILLLWLFSYFLIGLMGLFKHPNTLLWSLILLFTLFVLSQYIGHIKTLKSENQTGISTLSIALFTHFIFFGLIWLSGVLSNHIFGTKLLRITSASMSPTIVSGDILLSRKLNKDEILNIGDIIVYRDTSSRALAIKRVAKKPDWLQSKNNNSTIYLLGDNVSRSYDSRYFGAVERSIIVGKVTGLIVPKRKLQFDAYFTNL